MSVLSRPQGPCRTRSDRVSSWTRTNRNSIKLLQLRMSKWKIPSSAGCSSNTTVDSSKHCPIKCLMTTTNSRYTKRTCFPKCTAKMHRGKLSTWQTFKSTQISSNHTCSNRACICNSSPYKTAKRSKPKSSSTVPRRAYTSCRRKGKI